MQVTSKGQVTIPREIRNRLGPLPYTNVEFEMGIALSFAKSKDQAGEATRRRLVLEALHGTSDVRMSTDQIMALTRGSLVSR